MSRKALLLFLTVSLAWGLPYALIRLALVGFEPATIVFCRVVIGGLILLPIAASQRGALRGAIKHWPWLIAFAVIEIAGPWILLNTAEQHISSSLAGLLIGGVPFFAVPLAYVLGDKSVFHPKTILGVLLGFGGLIALAGIDSFNGTLEPIWLVAMILACLGYAIAPAIAAKKLGTESSIAVAGLSMAIVAAIYAVPGVTGLMNAVQKPAPVSAWLALAGLGLICTALAFSAFFKLIAEIGSARATLIVYPNLAIAFILGIVFLGEPVTPGFLVGLPLILVGSWLATRRYDKAAN